MVLHDDEWIEVDSLRCEAREPWRNLIVAHEVYSANEERLLRTGAFFRLNICSRVGRALDPTAGVQRESILHDIGEYIRFKTPPVAASAAVSHSPTQNQILGHGYGLCLHRCREIYIYPIGGLGERNCTGFDELHLLLTEVFLNEALGVSL